MSFGEKGSTWVHAISVAKGHVVSLGVVLPHVPTGQQAHGEG